MSERTAISFGKIPTLSTIDWSVDKMRQSWKWQGRSMESVMQRFINLNRKNLDYLKIDATIQSKNGKPTLRLTTSKYVGAIPIYSPQNGKAVGDLVVSGRFGEEAGELITLLDDSIRPEYSGEFQLVSDYQMTPPIFLECTKYIDMYLEAERFNWRKFTNITKIERRPSASTLWDEYAIRTAKNPGDIDIYKNKKNVLTSDHDEWAQLNYVLRLAIDKLSSVGTPQKIKAAYADKTQLMRVRLNDKRTLVTDKIMTRMSDPHIIRRLKALAQIILNNQTNEKLAWRMDYAEFFERYVQFLFGQVAKKKGAQEINNPHYPVSASSRLLWGLDYLEPDIVLQKESVQYVIDAKYKSHIYNRYNDSAELKNVFRHDLHQILAYSAFNPMMHKNAMIVYPYSDFIYNKMNINSPLTHLNTCVYLVGIPLEKAKIVDTVEKLSELLAFPG